MNRDQEQEDLAQADRHMAELKAHIVRQRLILGRVLGSDTDLETRQVERVKQAPKLTRSEGTQSFFNVSCAFRNPITGIAACCARDAANVILSAVGYNLRLVLAWLRMILRAILLALLQTFTIRPALKPAS